MAQKNKMVWLALLLCAAFAAAQGTASAQANADVALEKIFVTQAVYDEPLILNKDTVVRAVINAPQAMDVQVTVQFDGKEFTETKALKAGTNNVYLFVGAPQNFRAQTVTVRADAAGDPNPSNNTQAVTLPMVKPNEKVTAYFLGVDWTDEQRQRYNYATEFPKFVDENAVYLRNAYPLGKDQIVVSYAPAPHMLAANEKSMSNSKGDFDSVSSHLLYASISLAARRLKPDATLVVGVFPPGWYARHGNKSALGLALADVKGTVTAQYVTTDATTSAHELAHLYWLYEDYDYAVSPARPFTWLDKSGYFVEKLTPQEISDVKQIPTFLSAYAADMPSWVDSRIYEYLLAKYTIDKNGEVTEPMILAATMARQVEPDGKNYPSDYAAGFQRFEPNQTVYVSVGAAGMRGGEKLEARWFKGDQQIYTDSTTLKPGNAWYAFSLRNKNGMPQDKYRVEIDLDGKLVKTSVFEVKSSK